MSFLDDIFEIGNEEEVVGLTDELKCIYIYKRFMQENKSIVLVTSNLHTASKYYTSLSTHTDKVWFFPMDDFLTSEAIAISPEFKINRLETINHILKEEKSIIITNFMCYLSFLQKKEKFKNSYITLKTNKDYNQEELIQQLFKLVYKRQATVNVT
ncbi:MAG: hypothetical protein IJ093_04465 [Bacilli bacterium]|nr:hypothetical protein [Bacilli bacterium]